MIRALVFDVDGTLAETEEAHRLAFNDTFADHGLDWRWSRADYGRLLTTTGGKERMRRHRDEIGTPEPSDADIAALHAAKTRAYGALIGAGAAALRPGVAALIDEARGAGLRLAVATTTSRSNVDALARTAWDRPAEEVFDVIAAGDEVAAKKPAPDVYRLALERLGLDPAAALAFEDSANGVAAARAAGLRVAVTPSVYSGDEDFAAADWVLPSLARADRPPVLRFGG